MLLVEIYRAAFAHCEVRARRKQWHIEGRYLLFLVVTVCAESYIAQSDETAFSGPEGLCCIYPLREHGSSYLLRLAQPYEQRFSCMLLRLWWRGASSGMALAWEHRSCLSFSFEPEKVLALEALSCLSRALSGKSWLFKCTRHLGNSCQRAPKSESPLTPMPEAARGVRSLVGVPDKALTRVRPLGVT